MNTNKGLKAAALVGSLLIWIASTFLRAPSSADIGVASTSQMNAMIESLGQNRQQSIHSSAGVHGTVVVQTRPGAKSKKASEMILMPGIELYLHNLETNEDSPLQHSDMMGRFRFPSTKNGRYELRWRAQKGWAAGKFPDQVVVNGNTFYAELVTLQPGEGKGIITGTVRLADGTTPWFYSEELGVVKAASVTAIDARTNKTLSEPVLTNFAGQFAIAGIDRGARVRLAATSEASRIEVSLAGRAFIDSTTIAPVTITLKNHRPRILDVTATINGQPLRIAQPAATVQVKAIVEDPDRDTLQFKWSTTGGRINGEGPTVEWQLPQQPGNYTVTLLVTDGMGGAVTRQLGISVGKQVAIFSGMVVGPNGAAIAEADVSVNGVTGKSGRDGRFNIRPELSEKYVLNIYKSGFALLSRLLDRPVSQRWQLVQAQVETVQADKDISIIDRRPDVQKKKRGGSVQLTAGSFVDSSGKRASGALTAELATLDIANNEMPGDFLAIDNGKEVALISYGAMWVEFTDAAGQKLQLAPGAAATVSIPVPVSMRAKPPKKMAVWSYDEKDGHWKVSGTATYDAGQQAYVGTVTHLSTINMDQSGPVSCIRVHTDIGLPAGLTLRVRDVPAQGVDFAQVKSMVLDGEQNKIDGPLNAVFRVPANSAVQFEVLNDTGVLVSGPPNPMVVVEDGDTRGIVGPPLPNCAVPASAACNQVVAGPADPNLWPPYPYAGCKDVTLKLFPLWGGYPESPFLTFKAPLPSDPVASTNAANAYYDAIDPLHNRQTLSDWYSQNGFDSSGNPPVGSNPAEYARTSYLNNNDLGSGRDMNFHINPATGTLSAYVTNYSRGVAFDQRAAFADDAAARSNPNATVCMEFSTVEGDTSTTPPRKIVKFFVYNDAAGDGVAERQLAADLDGFGARFVPGLCINCHGYGPNGGYFDPIPAAINDVDIGASFRELDLATYHFPGNRVTPNAAEQAATRAQNVMIRDTAVATPASATQNPVSRGPIVDLINGWYGGAVQDNTFTPTNWKSPGSGSTQSEGLYQDVIKVSCRTCHIAFDSANNANGRDWNRYDQMTSLARRSTIQSYAVESGFRLMPHALVTFRNFWLQTSVSATPQGSRVQRLWEYSDGATWPAFGQPVLP